MKRRLLCFVTAGIFILLLSVPALACDHYDAMGDEVVEVRGYIPAQIGQAGYSGDRYCSICGALIAEGRELPALEDPERPPVVVTDTTSAPPEETETPAPTPTEIPTPTPAPTATPTPTPTSATTPTPTPEPAPTSELPVQVADPAEDTTVPPAPSEEPEEPAAPETPVIPAADPTLPPAVTGAPEITSAPQVTDVPVIPTDEPAIVTASPAPVKKQTYSSTPKPKRERFSKKYPYRRVRMHPQPGILAPAAGELVWPEPGTAFQGLFGD